MSVKLASKNGTTESGYVLVVEDHPTTMQQVCDTLAQGGFSAHVALDREDVLRHVEGGQCRAIILDLGLPHDDGVRIAKAIREWSGIPILMLTGRVRIHDRITGLEAGADDYVTKPFDPGELLARLKAVLRRSAKPAAENAPVVAAAIGATRLDVPGRVLSGPNGTATLTVREANLLLALCTTSGLLSRPAAYREVFRRNWDPSDRSLDVHVANVRRKLEAVSGEGELITAVRGEGYKLQRSVQLERDQAA